MANCAVVKSSVRIEEVIGRVVSLKRKGHWYIGLCPFHDDQHPSLVVWPKTGTWKCMTCSPRRDDVIGFVARWQGCSMGEALHILQEDLPVRPPLSRPSPAPAVLAALEERHATYQALITARSLTPLHRRDLHRRGLDDRAIERAGLTSTTPGIAPVRPTAAGVPGFYRQGTAWHLVGPAGLAIPVRTIDGAIQALHIRTSHVTKDKYRWLSTPDRLVGGASSGAPIHVVRGIDDVVWITEGPLKAIVAQNRLHHTVIGVPGVSNWQGVPDIIAQLRPKRVMVAFDRDANPKTAAVVHYHSQLLCESLARLGVSVRRARWDGPKGLDDALVAGAAIGWD